jgi:hypothetical protein
MTATVKTGIRVWEGERDDEGHRTFTVTHLVETSSKNDGPYTVMMASGLPAVGSTWNFGNDNDTWAFCYPYMKISRAPEIKEGEWVRFWRVDQKFSTKPLSRCQTSTISDPLSEPQQLSGSFTKYTKEATYNRFGAVIRSSSWEPFQGQQVEFDANRPTVKIGQNVTSLGLSTFANMIDTVNDSTLWGMSRRCVKLSNVNWERKLYGTCTYYYTRTFEFDIDAKTFDRYVVDEGNKVLNGHWDKLTGNWTLDKIGGSAPDKNNPRHFIKAIDRAGNPIRLPLNGAGEPLGIPQTGTGVGESLHQLKIEYYPESNFLSLGIPSSL